MTRRQLSARCKQDTCQACAEIGGLPNVPNTHYPLACLTIQARSGKRCIGRPGARPAPATRHPSPFRQTVHRVPGHSKCRQVRLADDAPVSTRSGQELTPRSRRKWPWILTTERSDSRRQPKWARISKAELNRMARAGVFASDERVELLGGWLVAKMAVNPPHRRSSRRSRVALERLIPPGYYVDQNAPVTMPITDSEPEPDVQVVRGDEGDYPDRHPGPPDVALAVEVSDSTISNDRNFKLRLYAKDAVPIYWIVNLVAMRLEVYTNPSGPTDRASYANRQDFGPEEEVPLILDGREVGRIAVRDVLP